MAYQVNTNWNVKYEEVFMRYISKFHGSYVNSFNVEYKASSNVQSSN